MTDPARLQLILPVPGTDEQVIVTPEVASQVLWHFNASSGIRPDKFTAGLIALIDRADEVNRAKLATAFPEYAAAVAHGRTAGTNSLIEASRPVRAAAR